MNMEPNLSNQPSDASLSRLAKAPTRTPRRPLFTAEGETSDDGAFATSGQEITSDINKTAEATSHRDKSNDALPSQSEETYLLDKTPDTKYRSSKLYACSDQSVDSSDQSFYSPDRSVSSSNRSTPVRSTWFQSRVGTYSCWERCPSDSETQGARYFDTSGSAADDEDDDGSLPRGVTGTGSAESTESTEELAPGNRDTSTDSQEELAPISDTQLVFPEHGFRWLPAFGRTSISEKEMNMSRKRNQRCTANAETRGSGVAVLCRDFLGLDLSQDTMECPPTRKSLGKLTDDAETADRCGRRWNNATDADLSDLPDMEIMRSDADQTEEDMSKYGKSSSKTDQSVGHTIQEQPSETDASLSLSGTTSPTQSDNPDSITQSENPASPTLSGNHASPTQSVNHASPTLSGNHASPTLSGNHASPTLSVNHASPTLSGNHASPTLSGNHANPTQSGNHASPTQSGNHGSPTQSGNHASPTLSGNHRSPTQSGNHASPTLSGNRASPTLSGNPVSPTLSGNSVSPTQSGNHASLTFSGNNAIPTLSGNSVSPTQSGNHLSPIQNGNAANPRQNGHPANPRQNGNAANPRQNGHPANPRQNGDAANPRQNGDAANPIHNGNHASPTLEANTSSGAQESGGSLDLDVDTALVQSYVQNVIQRAHLQLMMAASDGWEARLSTSATFDPQLEGIESFRFTTPEKEPKLEDMDNAEDAVMEQHEEMNAGSSFEDLEVLDAAAPIAVICPNAEREIADAMREDIDVEPPPRALLVPPTIDGEDDVMLEHVKLPPLPPIEIILSLGTCGEPLPSSYGAAHPQKDSLSSNSGSRRKKDPLSSNYGFSPLKDAPFQSSGARPKMKTLSSSSGARPKTDSLSSSSISRPKTESLSSSSGALPKTDSPSNSGARPKTDSPFSSSIPRPIMDSPSSSSGARPKTGSCSSSSIPRPKTDSISSSSGARSKTNSPSSRTGLRPQKYSHSPRSAAGPKTNSSSPCKESRPKTNSPSPRSGSPSKTSSFPPGSRPETESLSPNYGARLKTDSLSPSTGSRPKKNSPSPSYGARPKTDSRSPSSRVRPKTGSLSPRSLSHPTKDTPVFPRHTRSLSSSTVAAGSRPQRVSPSRSSVTRSPGGDLAVLSTTTTTTADVFRAPSPLFSSSAGSPVKHVSAKPATPPISSGSGNGKGKRQDTPMPSSSTKQRSNPTSAPRGNPTKRLDLPSRAYEELPSDATEIPTPRPRSTASRGGSTVLPYTCQRSTASLISGLPTAASRTSPITIRRGPSEGKNPVPVVQLTSPFGVRKQLHPIPVPRRPSHKGGTDVHGDSDIEILNESMEEEDNIPPSQFSVSPDVSPSHSFPQVMPWTLKTIYHGRGMLDRSSPDDKHDSDDADKPKPARKDNSDKDTINKDNEPTKKDSSDKDNVDEDNEPAKKYNSDKKHVDKDKEPTKKNNSDKENVDKDNEPAKKDISDKDQVDKNNEPTSMDNPDKDRVDKDNEPVKKDNSDKDNDPANKDNSGKENIDKDNEPAKKVNSDTDNDPANKDNYGKEHVDKDNEPANKDNSGKENIDKDNEPAKKVNSDKNNDPANKDNSDKEHVDKENQPANEDNSNKEHDKDNKPASEDNSDQDNVDKDNEPANEDNSDQDNVGKDNEPANEDNSDQDNVGKDNEPANEDNSDQDNVDKDNKPANEDNSDQDNVGKDNEPANEDNSDQDNVDKDNKPANEDNSDQDNVGKDNEPANEDNSDQDNVDKDKPDHDRKQDDGDCSRRDISSDFETPEKPRFSQSNMEMSFGNMSLSSMDNSVIVDGSNANKTGGAAPGDYRFNPELLILPRQMSQDEIHRITPLHTMPAEPTYLTAEPLFHTLPSVVIDSAIPEPEMDFDAFTVASVCDFALLFPMKAPETEPLAHLKDTVISPHAESVPTTLRTEAAAALKTEALDVIPSGDNSSGELLQPNELFQSIEPVLLSPTEHLPSEESSKSLEMLDVAIPRVPRKHKKKLIPLSECLPSFEICDFSISKETEQINTEHLQSAREPEKINVYLQSAREREKNIKDHFQSASEPEKSNTELLAPTASHKIAMARTPDKKGDEEATTTTTVTTPQRTHLSPPAADWSKVKTPDMSRDGAGDVPLAVPKAPVPHARRRHTVGVPPSTTGLGQGSRPSLLKAFSEATAVVWREEEGSDTAMTPPTSPPPPQPHQNQQEQEDKDRNPFGAKLKASPLFEGLPRRKRDSLPGPAPRVPAARRLTLATDLPRLDRLMAFSQRKHHGEAQGGARLGETETPETGLQGKDARKSEPTAVCQSTSRDARRETPETGLQGKDARKSEPTPVCHSTSRDARRETLEMGLHGKDAGKSEQTGLQWKDAHKSENTGVEGKDTCKSAQTGLQGKDALSAACQSTPRDTRTAKRLVTTPRPPPEQNKGSFAVFKDRFFSLSKTSKRDEIRDVGNVLEFSAECEKACLSTSAEDEFGNSPHGIQASRPWEDSASDGDGDKESRDEEWPEQLESGGRRQESQDSKPETCSQLKTTTPGVKERRNLFKTSTPGFIFNAAEHLNRLIKTQLSFRKEKVTTPSDPKPRPVTPTHTGMNIVAMNVPCKTGHPATKKDLDRIEETENKSRRYVQETANGTQFETSRPTNRKRRLGTVVANFKETDFAHESKGPKTHKKEDGDGQMDPRTDEKGEKVIPKPNGEPNADPADSTDSQTHENITPKCAAELKAKLPKVLTFSEYAEAKTDPLNIPAADPQTHENIPPECAAKPKTELEKNAPTDSQTVAEEEDEEDERSLSRARGRVPPRVSVLRRRSSSCRKVSPYSPEMRGLLTSSGVQSVLTPLASLRGKSPTAPPVYVVHPITGAVDILKELASGLDVRCVGIQKTDDAIDFSIETLARFYVQSILEEDRSGSYRLAGYSYGGMVVFEMARQMQRNGLKVSLLLMLDGAPDYVRGQTQYPQRQLPRDVSAQRKRAAWESHFLLFFMKMYGPLGQRSLLQEMLLEQDNEEERVEMAVGVTMGTVAVASSAARVRWLELESKMHAAGQGQRVTFGHVVDDVIGLKRKQKAMKFLQAVSIADRYDASEEALFKGDIDLIRIESSPEHCLPLPADYGLSSLCTGTVRTRYVQGEHETMMRAPHLASLISAVKEVLVQ